MNKKAIKYLITSLVLIGCLSTVSQTIMAGTISCSNNNLQTSAYYANNDNTDKNETDIKDKQKGFNLFNEDNYKYLSSDQKKELLEIKKIKDKGEKLSSKQEETINSIIDSIIKGKLGNENYEDFKGLIEKKQSNEKLNDDEEKRLKDYNDIINGTKLSTKEILNQFLR